MNTKKIYRDLEVPLYLKDNTQYKAPTQSLLQKWLREKYNYHIIILITCENEFYYIICKLNGVEHNGSCYNTKNSRYGTYEQALEVALYEILKLIKIK